MQGQNQVKLRIVSGDRGSRKHQHLAGAAANLLWCLMHRVLASRVQILAAVVLSNFTFARLVRLLLCELLVEVGERAWVTRQACH